MIKNNHCISGIHSEVGKLKKVLLHRPGNEINILEPRLMKTLLFDDTPWLERMQEEHDAFARVLKESGCSVYYYSDLLCEIMNDARQEVIEDLIDSAFIPNQYTKDALREYLSSMNAQELVDILIGGLPKSGWPGSDTSRLSAFISDSMPFYTLPMPNLFFTRDAGMVLGDGMFLSHMAHAVRQRESVLMGLLRKHHDMFEKVGQKLWYNGLMEGNSLEGGDVIVLSPQALAIGASVRSSSEDVELLARRLFSMESSFQKILVVSLPDERAYIHLDTVFTMVDRDSFAIFSALADISNFFILESSASGELKIHEEDKLEEALCHVMGLESVHLLSCSSDKDAIREQWNDGINTFALEPGKVLAYNRNLASNEVLNQANVKIVAIEGSELVRGRGGPHCMTMPLEREN